MNREEIIETLKDMLDETGLGHCSNQPEYIAINAAIDAINQFAEDNNVPVKQPDPDTGLIKCGCGGKARLYKDNYGGYWVECEACPIKAGYWESWADMEPNGSFTKEQAVATWNCAMGWRAEG